MADPRCYNHDIASAVQAAEAAAANGAPREAVRAALTTARQALAESYRAHQRWAWDEHTIGDGCARPADWLVAFAVAEAINDGHFSSALDLLKRVGWSADAQAQIQAVMEAHDRLWWAPHK